MGGSRPHRATTARLAALHPLAGSSPLAVRSTYIGRDLFGASFGFDPFALYAAGLLSNPNVVVAGQIGRGKSSLIKSFLWRQASLGRGAWVIDPKGEYSALADAAGCRCVRLGSDESASINLLEPASGGAEEIPLAVSAVAHLAEAAMKRDLRPTERAALEIAVGRTARGRNPGLSALSAALLSPLAEDAEGAGTDPAGLARDGRELALQIRMLASGEIGRVLEAPAGKSLDLGARLVVLDLSALHGTEHLGLVMGALLAWMGARQRHMAPMKRYVVLDEAWAVLSEPAVARWAQVSWKLARAYGVSNIAVVHRMSDLASVGQPASVQNAWAKGLLSDSETRVVFAQSPGEAEASRSLLGIGVNEAALLPSLGSGVALWKLGTRSFLVRHRLGTKEAALVDTDQAMRGWP